MEILPITSAKHVGCLPNKKIITYDLNGKENGFLIELTKDGKLTTSYLSCCNAGAFKGYHYHRVRAANYVCVKGRLEIILYTQEKKLVFELSADKPQTLHIPANIPTGLRNVSEESAWIVNTPWPAYDPDLKDEQIDYTEEQLEAIYKV